MIKKYIQGLFVLLKTSILTTTMTYKKKVLTGYMISLYVKYFTPNKMTTTPTSIS